MDDFYVYYEALQNDATKGMIKAISPSEITDLGDLYFIRVAPEVGMEFTVGDRSIGEWMVAWSNDKQDMVLAEAKPEAMHDTGTWFLTEVPLVQEKPQTVLTHRPGSFNVRTRGVSLSFPNVILKFFVTRKGDPNFLLEHFSVPLYETMVRKGVDMPVREDLPPFSVFTRAEIERYQLRIET